MRKVPLYLQPCKHVSKLLRMSDYRTALVMHEACGRHDTGWAHPEHQGRLPAILDAIYRETPALLDSAQQVEGTPATEEDVLRVHSTAYLEQLRRASALATESGRIV